MKRIIAIAVGVLAMLAIAVGISNADPGTNNDHGLCTAYFNGQKVGHNGAGPEDPDDPPPFQGLEETGRDYTNNDDDDNNNNGTEDEANEDDSLSAAENVFNYCNDGGLIGGNSEHGRFACTDPGTGAFNDPQTDPECDRREKPGNG